MAMTDAYGDAANYRARTGAPLAGQAADIARPPRATVRCGGAHPPAAGRPGSPHGRPNRGRCV